MSVVMPIGIVDESNESGGIMTLTRPGETPGLEPGTPIVIWSDDPRLGASAKMRGVLTETGPTRAGFLVTEQEIDPGWPDHVDPKGAGNPVYLGGGAGYLPDPRIKASPQEVMILHELARRHQEDTGIEPTLGVMISAPRGEAL